MPQIPEQGTDYPETSVPQPGPAPQMNIRMDPAAWGAVGAAAQHLGATGEEVGRQVAQVAYQQADLRNETRVNQASADYELWAGDRLEKLKALQGQNAVDAYKTFGPELEAERQRRREALDNDAQKRLFDNQSRSLTVRADLYGANHASEQQRKANKSANDALIDNTLSDLVLHAEDPEAIRTNMQRLDAAIMKQVQTEGLQNDQQVIDDRKGDLKSKGLWSIVRGLAKLDPQKAQDFLNQNRDGFRKDDLLKAQGEIELRSRNATSRVTSLRLREGYMPYLSQQEQKVVESIQPQLRDTAKRAMEILWDKGKDVEFTPRGGRRTKQDVEDIWEESKHGTLYAAADPRVGSNHEDGTALDMTPRKSPSPGHTAASYADIRAAMNQAASELGVKWSQETRNMRAAEDAGRRGDPPHWSIDKTQDLSEYKPLPRISFQKRLQIGTDYVESRNPDDPLIGSYFQGRFTTDTGEENRARVELEREQNNVLNGVMMDRGDGQEPADVDEWLHNPKVEAIMHVLNNQPDGATLRMQAIERFNTWKRAQSALTDPVEAARLEGLARSKNYDENQQFQEEMKTITANPKIGRAEQKHLRVMLNNMLAAAQDDPKISYAMEIAKTNLQPSITRDSQQMNLIRGVLSRQMQTFADTYNKLPNYNDILGMVERLKSTRANTPADEPVTEWIRQHIYGGESGFIGRHFLYPGEAGPFYGERPTTQDKADIIAEYQKQNGTVPDEQIINTIFLNRKYRERYGVPKPRQPGAAGSSLPFEAPAAPGFGP